jgi:hypothetical protein
MGCCRKRRRVVQQTTGPDYCKEIEDGGARFLVYPVRTTAGLKITAELTVNGHFMRVDLLDFLNRGNCNGPTVTWIRGQLPFIAQAIELQPDVFARYAGSGVALNMLVRTSRNIVKQSHA